MPKEDSSFCCTLHSAVPPSCCSRNLHKSPMLHFSFFGVAFIFLLESEFDRRWEKDQKITVSGPSILVVIISGRAVGSRINWMKKACILMGCCDTQNSAAMYTPPSRAWKRAVCSQQALSTSWESNCFMWICFQAFWYGGWLLWTDGKF